MYQISDSKLRSNAPRMSAFPSGTRPFTEPISATEDQVIGPGRTMIDLIKSYYPGTVPYALTARFGFMDRDNKERKYNPGGTDPFVFSSMGSLTRFSEQANGLLDELLEMWVALGLPVKQDADRKRKMLDVDVAWLAYGDKNHPLHQVVTTNADAIRFIVANHDIMKKACVVRTVTAGWWAVSYKGKTTKNIDFFKTSLNAHKRAFKIMLASPKGQTDLAEYWRTYGDPLLSNCGYPFFSAEVDKEGNPISKIKVVELFKGLVQNNPSWDEVLLEVDRRAGKFGMKGFPFTVAPLRRLQPGRKWIHQFEITGSGMRTVSDELGINSIRVAWMVPYIYNLLMSPLSTVYKTLRMMLPGCGHAGEVKKARAGLEKQWAAKGEFELAEADYSNYDRFIPVDIIRNLTRFICDQTDRPDYYYQGSMYLYENANLVWPDFSTIVDGTGYLFKPGNLGLMSGVKTTGDMGSLVNSVINAQALAMVKGWSEDRLTEYLTQYVNSPSGSKYEYYHVQSDDTLLIDTSKPNLHKRGKVFNEVAAIAGLKGSVELGDRFLMRHCQRGADRPVPARVWQNTISNESPPLSEIIFLAGLASRTDGLLGLKTVDPFGTGAIQPITATEALFSLHILESLTYFIGTESAIKSKLGLKLVDTLLQEKGAIEAAYAKGPSANFTASGKTKLQADELRREISRILAQFQLSVALANADQKSTTAWIYDLVKDRNVPSSALILEELIAMDPSLGAKIDNVLAKEAAFFKHASSEIGVKNIKIK